MSRSAIVNWARIWHKELEPLDHAAEGRGQVSSICSMSSKSILTEDGERDYRASRSRRQFLAAGDQDLKKRRP